MLLLNGRKRLYKLEKTHSKWPLRLVDGLTVVSQIVRKGPELRARHLPPTLQPGPMGWWLRVLVWIVGFYDPHCHLLGISPLASCSGLCPCSRTKMGLLAVSAGPTAVSWGDDGDRDGGEHRGGWVRSFRVDISHVSCHGNFSVSQALLGESTAGQTEEQVVTAKRCKRVGWSEEEVKKT